MTRATEPETAGPVEPAGAEPDRAGPDAASTQAGDLGSTPTALDRDAGTPAMMTRDAAPGSAAPVEPADDEQRATIAARHRWPWLLVMIAIGVAGAYLGAPSSETVYAAIDRVRGAKIAAAIAVIGGAIGLVITEALRIAVIGRLVGARVGARDAWDAAVANHVMTAVTPQVGLGEPTVAYLLGKRGVPWDAAVAIPFIKFSTSLALVFVLGAALVVAGDGPPVAPWISAVAVAWFLGIAIVTAIVIAAVARRTLALRWIAGLARWCRRRRLLARWPAKIEAFEDGARGLVDRIAAVRRWTWRDAAVLIAVHLVYYASYIAPLVAVGLALGDPAPVTFAARSLVYLCFVFAIPTPGGAGPSEAAAVLMFGDLLPADDALAAVILFRAATFYLQLAIGALYLPVAAALGWKPR